MTRAELLFSTHSLFDVIENHRQLMRKEIGDLTAGELAAKEDALWCEHFEQKYKFDIPRLRTGEIQADRLEVEVDVSGDPNRNPFRDRGPINVKAAEITFFVPFDGDEDIFLYRPSQSMLNRPRGSVRAGELRLTYVRVDQDGIKARQEFDNDLQAIQQHLIWAEDSVRQFNLSIRADALNLLTQRRIKLNRDREMDASLGFPLRHRTNVPAIYAPPAIRLRLNTARPAPVAPTSATPSASEPFLEMQVYDHILTLIAQMATVIERSPEAFRTMGEEDIRFVLLVPLNSHYEGQAAGEAFNFEGKTDILIREKGKNVFIAECKFWDGPESMRSAIDQLLGYACWRDTKTALLIFNRGRQLSTVLSKIPESIKAHPNFKREAQYNSETGFRFVLHHRDDTNRELYLTVLVFEVPS